MKCSECTGNLYHLLDNSSDTMAAALKQHIADCTACYAEYEAMMDVVAVLKPKGDIKAPASLKEKIMKQAETATAKTVRMKPRWKRFTVAAAVVALILITPFLFKNGSGQTKASNLILSAINAGSTIQNFVMQFSVRTNPTDNFEDIDAGKPMVPHTIMRSFTAPNAWSVKKAGRTVVFDGTSQYLYIPSGNVVYKGGEDAGFVSWMRLLLDPESVLWKEKENAESSGAIVKTFAKDGDSCLHITTKAAGNFMNDYLRNENIGTADSRREYVFDGKSHLLKTLKIFLLKEKNETLIFSLDTIEYNTNIPLSEFSFSIPAGAELKTAPDLMPSQKDATTGISSTVAARMALEDLSKGDFETHKYLWSQYSQLSLKIMHKGYAGCRVIRTGEPFHSAAVYGDVVPYEIKFPDGYIKKFRIVLENNKPAKLWSVKGGL